MDKYDLLLDVIEHPEKYPIERLNDLLADPETREIYNLICKTDSAMEMQHKADVEEEWMKFSRRHFSGHSRARSFRVGIRAASIAAIVGTSMIALATGIAISKYVTTGSNVNSEEEKNAGSVIPSVIVERDTIVMTGDSVENAGGIVMFDDASLREIMETVAKHYGVEVRFLNEEAARLHLYYRLDRTSTLDEVTSQLNTFEQITIKRNGNKLTVE